jgi:hypothetical protein
LIQNALQLSCCEQPCHDFLTPDLIDTYNPPHPENNRIFAPNTQLHALMGALRKLLPDKGTKMHEAKLKKQTQFLSPLSEAKSRFIGVIARSKATKQSRPQRHLINAKD